MGTGMGTGMGMGMGIWVWAWAWAWAWVWVWVWAWGKEPGHSLKSWSATSRVAPNRAATCVPQSSLKQLDGIMFNLHLKTLGLSQSLHLSSNDIIFKALDDREKAPSFSRRAPAEAEPADAPAGPTEKHC